MQGTPNESFVLAGTPRLGGAAAAQSIVYYPD
jgi:hypothetical protein